MITLYQYEPAMGLPNASPFCMKLETWLRMAQLPYEAPPPTLRDMGRAPKGKMPYIADGGRTLADSTFIIDYLKATYGDRLDAWLTQEQRAVALAFQRLMEENQYWAVVHTRWMEPMGWAQTRTAFFGSMPAPLKWIIPTLARRGLRQQLRGHGMGRHGEGQPAVGSSGVRAQAARAAVPTNAGLLPAHARAVLPAVISCPSRHQRLHHHRHPMNRHR